MSDAPSTDLDLLEHAVADTKRPNRGRRLSIADRAYILKARSRPHPPTIAEIARVIGCAESTVYHVLAAAQLDVIPVLATYAADAAQMMVTAAEKAADKGYITGAERLLQYANKLPTLAPANSTQLAVQVNVAVSPGTPGYASPTTLALDTFDAVATPTPTSEPTTLTSQHAPLNLDSHTDSE